MTRYFDSKLQSLKLVEQSRTMYTFDLNLQILTLKFLNLILRKKTSRISKQCEILWILNDSQSLLNVFGTSILFIVNHYVSKWSKNTHCSQVNVHTKKKKRKKFLMKILIFPEFWMTVFKFILGLSMNLKSKQYLRPKKKLEDQFRSS